MFGFILQAPSFLCGGLRIARFINDQKARGFAMLFNFWVISAKAVVLLSQERHLAALNRWALSSRQIQIAVLSISRTCGHILSGTKIQFKKLSFYKSTCRLFDRRLWDLCRILGTSILLGGCYLPPKNPASATVGNAFIRYWPAATTNSQLTLAVKDNIDMQGVVTTAGSEYLAKTGKPATRDARCLEGARSASVPIVGKTNLTEFALSVSGINGYFGTPKNHRLFDRRIIPGGSSSGAAVVVEFGRADLSFGTDTAGSIRVPAACCGVYGLKTTFGLVPLDGVFPISPKYLDTVGPLAWDVPRLVLGMNLLQNGFAERYKAAVRAQPSGRDIKVGRLYLDGTNPAIDDAIDKALADAGFRVTRLDDNFKAKWVRANKEGMTIALADSWVTNQKFLNKAGVNIVTKAAIRLGKLEHDFGYAAALRYRVVWRKTMRDVFEDFDLIVLPTLQDRVPNVPFFGGSSALFELRVSGLQNTVPVNLSGNPALAMPIPLGADRMHVTSMQIVGPPMGEANIVNASRIVGTAIPARPPAEKWWARLGIGQSSGFNVATRVRTMPPTSQ